MVTTVKSLVHSNRYNTQIVTTLKWLLHVYNDRALNNLVHSQQQTPVFEMGGQEYLYRWSVGRYPGERYRTSARQDQDIQGEGQNIVSITQDQDIQSMGMP